MPPDSSQVSPIGYTRRPRLGVVCRSLHALFLKGEIMSSKEQRLRRATIAVVAPLHQEAPAEAFEERAEAVEHWRGEDGSSSQLEHLITAPES